MSFVTSLNLGTVGDHITSVKLYACTDSGCIDCVALSGYTNVLVSSFPMNINDVPTGTSCSMNSRSVKFSNPLMEVQFIVFFAV